MKPRCITTELNYEVLNLIQLRPKGYVRVCICLPCTSVSARMLAPTKIGWYTDRTRAYARTYFHPTTFWQPRQNISRTVCFPVVMSRSTGTPSIRLVLYEFDEI